MNRYPMTAIAFVALSLTLFLTGCASTGSTAKPPLDPAKADAVVAVKGMSCPQCSHNIALLMDATDEIDQSRVDLGNGKVYIAFAPNATLSEDKIADLVDRAGFTPGKVEYLKQGGE